VTLPYVNRVRDGLFSVVDRGRILLSSCRDSFGLLHSRLAGRDRTDHHLIRYCTRERFESGKPKTEGESVSNESNESERTEARPACSRYFGAARGICGSVGAGISLRGRHHHRPRHRRIGTVESRDSASTARTPGKGGPHFTSRLTIKVRPQLRPVAFSRLCDFHGVRGR